MDLMYGFNGRDPEALFLKKSYVVFPSTSETMKCIGSLKMDCVKVCLSALLIIFREHEPG